ncbi:uncharacterized protein LOC135098788 [Scylla paramamosain]|uniref:uncharacterized protein LOC135098788 n=1 Tax=Scylla paramamosain TaxID=85552 RepID=UPI003082DC89
MGLSGSSLKVAARLHLVGQCGGVDRLTLSRPRRRGGQRLLASFSFPSAGGGAGHHWSARETAMNVSKLAKREGKTPVRLDFLAGESLVARREIPLAELLAGLRANSVGRRAVAFLALEGGQAALAGDADDDHGHTHVAVFFNERRVDDTGVVENAPEEPESSPFQEQPNLSQQVIDTSPSLPQQAGDNKGQTHEAHEAGDTEASCDLGDGQRWTPAPSHTKPSLPLKFGDNKGHTHQPHQAGDDEASLTQEVTHRDLADGQRWTPTPSHTKSSLPQKAGEKTGHTHQPHKTGDDEASLAKKVTHRDLGDGQRRTPAPRQLRQRRGKPRGASSEGGRERDFSQRSITSPAKQGKAPQRPGRGGGRWSVCGSCLLDNVLMCAQAMALTLLTYHVSLEWF